MKKNETEWRWLILIGIIIGIWYFSDFKFLREDETTTTTILTYYPTTTTIIFQALCDKNKDCKDDEICLYGMCEKASFTIIFAPHHTINTAEEKNRYNLFVDESVSGIKTYFPVLKTCPEKIRVHVWDEPKCICDGDGLPEKDCINGIIQEWDLGIILMNETDIRLGGIGSKCGPDKREHPWTEDTKNIFIAKTHLFFGEDKYYHSYIIHEIGHHFRLWDEYCYQTREPNPVDFEDANCFEMVDERDKRYCSNNFPEISPPYQCFGNLAESSSGHCVMGSGWDENPAFCNVCQTHLENIIKC